MLYEVKHRHSTEPFNIYIILYNTKITRKEEGFEELIQVVEAHCKKFSMKSKKDLESFIRYIFLSSCNVCNFIWIIIILISKANNVYSIV